MQITATRIVFVYIKIANNFMVLRYKNLIANLVDIFVEKCRDTMSKSKVYEVLFVIKKCDILRVDC